MQWRGIFLLLLASMADKYLTTDIFPMSSYNPTPLYTGFSDRSGGGMFRAYSCAEAIALFSQGMGV